MLRSISLCEGLWNCGMCSSKKMMTCHPLLNSRHLGGVGHRWCPVASYGCAECLWHPSGSDHLLSLVRLKPWLWHGFGPFSRWHQVLEACKQARAASMGLIAVVLQEPPSTSALKDDTQHLRNVEVVLIQTALAAPALRTHWILSGLLSANILGWLL